MTTQAPTRNSPHELEVYIRMPFVLPRDVSQQRRSSMIDTQASNPDQAMRARNKATRDRKLAEARVYLESLGMEGHRLEVRLEQIDRYGSNLTERGGRTRRQSQSIDLTAVLERLNTPL